MQDLSIDIKMMPQVFRGYHLLLVIICEQSNFTIAVPLRDRTAQTVAEALIYRVIYIIYILIYSTYTNTYVHTYARTYNYN